MAPDSPLILMTRPEPAAQRFLTDLQARVGPVRALISPVMEIVFRQCDLPDAAGLIFTSANGVAGWAKQGATPRPAYVVGPATAKAARDAGLEVRITAKDADALVAALTQERPDSPLLHLTGVHRRGAVAERLNAAGVPTQRIEVYDQPARPLSEAACRALRGETPLIVPVFSPRTAQLLALDGAKAPLLVAAMSEAVVNALPPFHIVRRKVAARPDSEGMLDAVEHLLIWARTMNM